MLKSVPAEDAESNGLDDRADLRSAKAEYASMVDDDLLAHEDLPKRFIPNLFAVENDSKH